jgi:hypothetical protein
MVLSTAILWGLGWRLARARTHFSAFIGEFQFGLAIFLIGFFLDANWGRKSLVLIPAALSFFPLALLGISVSNGSEQTSWLASPNKRFWLGFLFLSIGLILALGLLVSVAVSPSVVDFLLSLLARAGLWILDMIGNLLHLLASLFPPPKPGSLPPALQMAPGKAVREHAFELFSESTREVMRFIWGAGFFTLIMVALWRICADIFEWLRRKLGGMEGAEVETLPGAFREDLLELLKRILLLFRIKWPWRGRKKSLSLLAETEFVRRVYRQLLQWAATRGCARHLSQTPMEYLQNLLQWLPEGQSDLTFITHQYVRARYSLEVPTEKEVGHLETSWVRLKRVRFKKGARRIPKDRR